MTAHQYFTKTGFIWELYFSGQISMAKREKILNAMRAIQFK